LREWGGRGSNDMLGERTTSRGNKLTSYVLEKKTHSMEKGGRNVIMRKKGNYL